ncbi:MAG: HNH endonuclease [Planctomycetaceae bacterium]|nr:HNH endonuclease [Planctomycetaceae bacterium]
MSSTIAFAYPATRHVRHHGPYGYTDYESFREWLRDEFCFRCVFCLYREQWPQPVTSFDIDHFIPVAADPAGQCCYDNLLYACSRCNSVKNDKLAIPSPEDVALSDCLRVQSDGTIEALNDSGMLLIRLLKLDHPKLVRTRKLILETLQVLEGTAPLTYIEWMRFPDELPDLSRKHASGNSRPLGIQQSWLVRKSRGELPEIY